MPRTAATRRPQLWTTSPPPTTSPTTLTATKPPAVAACSRGLWVDLSMLAEIGISRLLPCCFGSPLQAGGRSGTPPLHTKNTTRGGSSASRAALREPPPSRAVVEDDGVLAGLEHD